MYIRVPMESFLLKVVSYHVFSEQRKSNILTLQITAVD